MVIWTRQWLTTARLYWVFQNLHHRYRWSSFVVLLLYFKLSSVFSFQDHLSQFDEIWQDNWAKRFFPSFERVDFVFRTFWVSFQRYFSTQQLSSRARVRFEQDFTFLLELSILFRRMYYSSTTRFWSMGLRPQLVRAMTQESLTMAVVVTWSSAHAGFVTAAMSGKNCNNLRMVIGFLRSLPGFLHNDDRSRITETFLSTA